MKKLAVFLHLFVLSCYSNSNKLDSPVSPDTVIFNESPDTPVFLPVDNSDEKTTNEVIPKKTYKVAFFGDSLTDYKSYGGGFIRYLEKMCPASRFDNFGMGGKLVVHMKFKMKHIFLNKFSPVKYSHVVIFGGVNDVCSDGTDGRNLSNITYDLEVMYGISKESGSKTVAITIAPWGRFKMFNEKRKELYLGVNSWIFDKKSSGLVDHVIDTSFLSCGRDSFCPKYERKWVNDGLHFNEEAQELIGKKLYDEVFKNCQ